jgi:RecJ-like exonuclease
MLREVGKATPCPNCRGEGKLAKRRCLVCRGEKNVEYQESNGHIVAPAGSWLPTNRRGSSGWIIVVFGKHKQEMTR